MKKTGKKEGSYYNEALKKKKSSRAAGVEGRVGLRWILSPRKKGTLGGGRNSIHNDGIDWSQGKRLFPGHDPPAQKNKCQHSSPPRKQSTIKKRRMATIERLKKPMRCKKKPSKGF